MPCRFTRHAWPPKRVRGRSGHLPTACRAGGVDGRNKSGHDGEGPLGKTCPLTGPRQRPPNRHARTRSIAVRFNLRGGLCRNGRDRRRPPCCHPGLVPGPREAGRGRCLWPPDRCPGQAWAPEQVRGDKGRTRKAGESVPQSVSRSGECAGNPPVPTPCTRSSPSNPDTSGLVPGIHGRRPDRMRKRMKFRNRTPRASSRSSGRRPARGSIGKREKIPRNQRAEDDFIQNTLFCLTRDAFWGIFRTVGKWGRRRFRRPFFVPAPPASQNGVLPRW